MKYKACENCREIRAFRKSPNKKEMVCVACGFAINDIQNKNTKEDMKQWKRKTKNNRSLE